MPEKLEIKERAPVRNEKNETAESIYNAWFGFAVFAIVLNWVFVNFDIYSSSWVTIYPHEWSSLIAVLFYSFAQSVPEQVLINIGFIFLISSYLDKKKAPPDEYFGAMVLGAFLGGLAIWFLEDRCCYYAGLSNIGFALLGYAIMKGSEGKSNRTLKVSIAVILIVLTNFRLFTGIYHHITKIGHVGGLIGGLLAGVDLDSENDGKSE